MIYVLVPARDEAPTVGLLLWKIRQVFTGFSREYHLIVVNDGSSDGSDDVLASYGRALPMTLITHASPLGYARSLEELLRAAVQRSDRPRRDVAVTIQADFSESPDDIPELVKRVEGGADLVLGVRNRRATTSLVERLARGLVLPVARRALGVAGAAEVVGTMRAYRLAVVERALREAGGRPLLGGRGWAADVELLSRASRHARRIESVQLNGRAPPSRRRSRSRPLAEAWRSLRAALARPAAGAVQASDSRRSGRRRRNRGRGRRPSPSAA